MPQLWDFNTIVRSRMKAQSKKFEIDRNYKYLVPLFDRKNNSKWAVHEEQCLQHISANTLKESVTNKFPKYRVRNAKDKANTVVVVNIHMGELSTILINFNSRLDKKEP